MGKIAFSVHPRQVREGGEAIVDGKSHSATTISRTICQAERLEGINSKQLVTLGRLIHSGIYLEIDEKGKVIMWKWK